MELDLGVIRRKASETLVISHASIIVPFLMGMGLAYVVYPEFGARHASFVPFALFVAISVSITAFPVLARIVQERNLSKTPMGMLAIASAANNDVTATIPTLRMKSCRLASIRRSMFPMKKPTRTLRLPFTLTATATQSFRCSAASPSAI